MMTCSTEVHRNYTLAIHLTENGKACGRKSGADIFMKECLGKPVSGAIVIISNLVLLIEEIIAIHEHMSLLFNLVYLNSISLSHLELVVDVTHKPFCSPL
jgi:hypothetical protein